MTESAEQTVTITNTGTTDYTLPQPVIEGPNPQAFELLGTCFSLLQPTQICTWTVRFTPDHAWTRTAVLRVAPGHEVVLQGTGVGVFDVSGCGGCGGCQHGGAAPWGLALLGLGLLRRQRPSVSTGG
jgi:MYXO-CTERM domain-containing protein